MNIVSFSRVYLSEASAPTRSGHAISCQNLRYPRRLSAPCRYPRRSAVALTRFPSSPDFTLDSLLARFTLHHVCWARRRNDYGTDFMMRAQTRKTLDVKVKSGPRGANNMPCLARVLPRPPDRAAIKAPRISSLSRSSGIHRSSMQSSRLMPHV